MQAPGLAHCIGHAWGSANAALGWARPKAAVERSESDGCGQWSQEALASHCEGAREGEVVRTGCGNEQAVAWGTLGRPYGTHLEVYCGAYLTAPGS